MTKSAPIPEVVAAAENPAPRENVQGVATEENVTPENAATVTDADGVEHVGVIPADAQTTPGTDSGITDDSTGFADAAPAEDEEPQQAEYVDLPSGTGNGYWARQAQLAIDGVESNKEFGALTYLHVLKAATFKVFASSDPDEILAGLSVVSNTAESWTEKLEVEKAVAQDAAAE